MKKRRSRDILPETGKGKMSAERNRIVRDLNQGGVWRTMIVFAAPLLLSSLVQMLYNTADMVIVGHFVGKEGLGAVSIGGEVMHFLLFAATGFCNAGQVIIAQ